MPAEERIWRSRIPGVTTLAFLTLLIGFSASEKVYLRSLGRTRTIVSLNLLWVKGEQGSRPDDAVRGSLKLDVDDTESLVTANGEGNDEGHKTADFVDVFVCRAHHEGTWLPGYLSSSSTACKVSQDGVVYAHGNYEVLQNEGGGTKLTWVLWNHRGFPPHGAVDVDGSSTYYVARRESVSQGKDKRNEYGIGKLDSRERKYHLTVSEVRAEGGKQSVSNRRVSKDYNVVPDEMENIFESGKVLVAADPKSYELSNIELRHNPNDVHSFPVVLATGQLVGSELSDYDEREELVHTVLPYENEYSIQWGQGKGILKGLPTTLVSLKEDQHETGQGGPADSFKWGEPKTWRNQEEKRVEKWLLPGTAANVSLSANKTASTTPCKAHLITLFADGSKMSRNVSVTRRVEKFHDFRLQVGPIYFLSNGTLAPTTISPINAQETNTTENTSPTEEPTTNIPVKKHVSTTKQPPRFSHSNTREPHTDLRKENSPQKPTKERESSVHIAPTPNERTGKEHDYDPEVCKTGGNKVKCSNVASAASKISIPFWGRKLLVICVPIVYFIVFVHF